MNVHLAAPEWVSGTVTIELIPSLTLTGQPSLFSDNRCAVTTPLDAAQARALREDWDRGLPAARICYRMLMRVSIAAHSTTGVYEATFGGANDRVTERSSERTKEFRGVSAGTQSIAIEGPLWTPGLADVITEIDMS